MGDRVRREAVIYATGDLEEMSEIGQKYQKSEKLAETSLKRIKNKSHQRFKTLMKPRKQINENKPTP